MMTEVVLCWEFRPSSGEQQTDCVNETAYLDTAEN